MKRIVAITLMIWSFSGCEKNEMVVSTKPYIKLQGLEYVPSNNLDSLIIKIWFQDGDMDLGLNYDETDPPFHPFNLFLEHNNALLDTIPVIRKFNLIEYYFPVVGTNSGKLVTNRTRNTENYSYLPEVKGKLTEYPEQLPHDEFCNYHSDLNVAIDKENWKIIDDTFHPTDTVINSNQIYILIADYLLVDRNPQYFNIEIDFLIQQENGSFEEFDFYKEFCLDFDGRFPSGIANQDKVYSGPFQLERTSKTSGNLTYILRSSFLSIFRDKTLKLKIKIRDRTLQESNTLETPLFKFS